MGNNYSYSEREYSFIPVLRKRLDTLVNILSFMWISVLSESTEVENEGLIVVQ